VIIFGGRGVVSIDVGVCVNPDEFTVGVTFEGPSTGGDGAGVVSEEIDAWVFELGVMEIDGI
tara:strand:- start:5661 stop:5846 length:186 start_codon:yes stop_codon:yes gene_type:complete